ncbi:hypothetical protein [Bacillus cereus group sp. MYBK104-1]|uniref:hypothetical protein n=1 Tax=unclassified Bacillus cereus group TaxID=2750818 RepID=UPI003F7AF3CA
MQEEAKPPNNLAAEAGQRKAQAARSDCEGDGASDVKALFALQEEAKPPNNLATETETKKFFQKTFSHTIISI